jgi:hypothetical protein
MEGRTTALRGSWNLDLTRPARLPNVLRVATTGRWSARRQTVPKLDGGPGSGKDAPENLIELGTPQGKPQGNTKRVTVS